MEFGQNGIVTWGPASNSAWNVPVGPLSNQKATDFKDCGFMAAKVRLRGKKKPYLGAVGSQRPSRG